MPADAKVARSQIHEIEIDRRCAWTSHRGADDGQEEMEVDLQNLAWDIKATFKDMLVR